MSFYAHSSPTVSSLTEASVWIDIPPHVSLLELAKAVVFFLLMVKPLWSGDMVQARLWLSKYDSRRQSNLSQLKTTKKTKTHCHNNKSGMENEVF